MSETPLMNRILVALSALPNSLFKRANTGKGWVGRQLLLPVGATLKIEQDMIVLRAAYPIKFGVKGQGDIEGVVNGRAVNVEVKTDTGRQHIDQKKYEKAFEKAGGIYILARSPEAALRALTERLNSDSA